MSTEQGARKKEASFLVEVDLRDYFAAKAMQSIISIMGSAQYNYTGAEDVASDAYAFADAMIKAREICNE